MPAWIHDRAHHIMRDSPGTAKSTAYAVATQQAHATDHAPKGYGTSEGKREAKQKYDEPKSEYKQTADPSHKSKSASIDVAMWAGFTDELSKIAAALTTKPSHVAALARPKFAMAKPRATSIPRDLTGPSTEIMRTSQMNPPPLSTSAG